MSEQQMVGLKNDITTERLILRQWRQSDLEPFAELNADPRVREFFLGVLSREESNREVIELSRHIDNSGWGFWAVSLRQTDEFIGCIGLDEVYFKMSFSPAIDIGWRLAYNHWGKGYATEGAMAALRYGFDVINLQAIVAYTAVQNMLSRHVMDKIGMCRDPHGDFDHPDFPDDHKHKRHVLYRINSRDANTEEVKA
jgi:3-dehydroquinate dehydratase / shikimate dehydrogenase